MFLTYLKIAWRNVMRHKIHSLQNILGLSLALAVALAGFVYIYHETSYDSAYKNADRIFRINTDMLIGEQDRQTAQCSDVIGPLWKNHFAEVESFVRLYPISSVKIKKENNYILEGRAAYADTSLFNIFTIPIISQSGARPLSEPNTIVLTSSMAKKYLGAENVAGKTIDISDLANSSTSKRSYKVVGVIPDFPDNSHFRFDFLFPFSDMEFSWNRNYGGNYFSTYILLKDPTKNHELNKKFVAITKTDIYPIVSKQLGLKAIDWESFEQTGNRLRYSLFPLKEIHLSSNRENELDHNGSLQSIYILGVLIIFTLLMACTNFVNLSTALAMSRARQIGVHKVIGGTRKKLVLQMLAEALILVVVSMILACGIVILLLPFLNDLLGVSITINNFSNQIIFSGIAITIIVITLLAGFYPAFYLSGINILAALQGQHGFKTGGHNLRRSLVVFQFIMAFLMIVGTITIYSQLHYMKTLDVGYSKEQVLIVDNISVLKDKAVSFRNETIQLPGVMSTSLSTSLPVNASTMQAGFSRNPTRSTTGGVPVRTWWVDEQYFDALNIEFLKGGGFSATKNLRKVIVNEEAVKAFGLTDPLRQKIYTQDTFGYTIVGIVKNFHFESLKQPIAPLVLNFSDGQNIDFAIIRFAKNTDIHRQLSLIKSTWKKLSPVDPINFYFLDEAFNNTYRSDQVLGNAALTVSVITVLICCVGLFGLITFITARKTKEIGVRKVLGASSASIIRILTKDFVTLIAIAVVIATPISWWLMSLWLQDFVYRIDMEWWMFVITALSALLITLITVGFQAAKAAAANPVISLRAE